MAFINQNKILSVCLFLGVIILIIVSASAIGAKPALFRFTAWSGAGVVSATAPIDSSAFASLTFNEPVDSSSYSVTGTDTSTTITLSEKYLTTLNLDNGEHYFSASFSKVGLGSEMANLSTVWSVETSSAIALIPAISEVDAYLGSILLNGNVVDTSNYSLDEAGHVIIFSQVFIDSLPEGYSLQALMLYDDIVVSLLLPVAITQQETNNLPATNDPVAIGRENARMVLLLIAGGCAVALSTFFDKKLLR
jgi:hypothetical protein